MTVLYRQRYRVPSIRMPRWDYRSPGWYFVTICVKNRSDQPFGFIHNGIMCVSDIGKIIYDEWFHTGRIRNNVRLDQFMVMPDHIHGIITITRRLFDKHLFVETPRRGVSTDGLSGYTDGSPNTNELKHMNESHDPNILFDTDELNIQRGGYKTEWQSNSLGAIMNQFKSISTKRIRASGYPSFQWQPRYFEKIIRSQQELHNVRRYILNNPRQA